MIVLALDLATNSGWASDAGDGSRPASGTWDLGGPFHDDDARHLRKLAAHMDNLIEERNPSLVVVEKPLPFFGSRKDRRGNTHVILWQLNAVAKLVCAEHGVSFSQFPPQTWRKGVFGRGNLKRDEAKARALAHCRLMRWPADGDNAAEACCLWSFAKARSEPRWQPKPMGAS